MLAFAIDQPAPAAIVVITGDRDFAYAVSILRLRGYEMIVIVPPVTSHVSLRMHASVVFDWRRDVLESRRAVPKSGEDATVSATVTLPPISEGSSNAFTPHLASNTACIAEITSTVVSSSASVETSHSSSVVQAELSSPVKDHSRALLHASDEPLRCGIEERDDQEELHDPTVLILPPMQPPEATFGPRAESCFLAGQFASPELIQNMHSPAIDSHDIIAAVSEHLEITHEYVAGEEEPTSRLINSEDPSASQRTASLPDLPPSTTIPPLADDTRMEFVRALGESEIRAVRVVSPSVGEETIKICSPVWPNYQAESKADESSRSATPRTATTLIPASFAEELIDAAGSSPYERASEAGRWQASECAGSNLPSSPQLPTPPTAEGTERLLDSADATRVSEERFALLIDVFREKKATTGATKIRSSEVAVELRKNDPAVYSKAGTARLKDYLAAARNARIVVSPGPDKHGSEWVEIDARFYGDMTAGPSSSAIPAPAIDDAQASSRSNTRRTIPPLFVPVVSTLQQSLPKKRILFSHLGMLLQKGSPSLIDSLYRQANVTSLGQYLQLATMAHVVRTGALESPGLQWLYEAVPVCCASDAFYYYYYTVWKDNVFLLSVSGMSWLFDFRFFFLPRHFNLLWMLLTAETVGMNFSVRRILKSEDPGEDDREQCRTM